ncbi:transcriptional regulator [Streptomyces oceani]|uniref:Transcriptional regulator n=1 Tax=Streptomyces oceani TaxID=1075402 RepID=A0A1E7KIX6_9ACTN|nr:transcriptional regulator [Streptomyces oceani]OEV03836.1 hypothetical protein AN216_09230 [Streptomyces oceani]
MAQDYRWRRLGEFGAEGMPGGAAVGLGLERMVTGITFPPDSARGIAARLRYLTDSPAGYAAMEHAGITVTARTLYAWLAAEQTPSAANRAKLDDAYWTLRRQRVLPALTRRLARGGGTRVEIDPADPSDVPRRNRRRNVGMRRLTIRPTAWNAAVDAWAAGDAQGLQRIWEDAIADLGSDWDAYTFVSCIGWSA